MLVAFGSFRCIAVPIRIRSFDTATLHAEYALWDGPGEPVNFSGEVELTADTFQKATALAYTGLDEPQAPPLCEYHPGTIDRNTPVSPKKAGVFLSAVFTF
jgi:hypothetical protein